jgi:hypothetical protein
MTNIYVIMGISNLLYYFFFYTLLYIGHNTFYMNIFYIMPIYL